MRSQDKFHSPECYDIGPYSSTQAYVLACYDKEIYYYTNAPNSDFDKGLSDTVVRGNFIKTLQETRDRLALSTPSFLPEQPFTLVHNDLSGRNIMMRDKKIAAVIDWEFAGSYPLSEMMGGRGVDLLEMVDSETEEECNAWSLRVEELVAVGARAMGWDKQKVELLVGAGNDELGLARMEMVPDWIFDDEKADDGAGKDSDKNAGLS